jgi:hypothetical protein
VTALPDGDATDEVARPRCTRSSTRPACGPARASLWRPRPAAPSISLPRPNPTHRTAGVVTVWSHPAGRARSRAQLQRPSERWPGESSASRIAWQISMPRSHPPVLIITGAVHAVRAGLTGRCWYTFGLIGAWPRPPASFSMSSGRPAVCTCSTACVGRAVRRAQRLECGAKDRRAVRVWPFPRSWMRYNRVCYRRPARERSAVRRDVQ